MDVLPLVDGRGELLQDSSAAGQRAGQTGQFAPTWTAGHKHVITRCRAGEPTGGAAEANSTKGGLLAYYI